MWFDKRVDGSCSLYRQDVLIDVGFPIVIEYDENKHSNCRCEEKRMMSIFKDLGKIPLKMILFSPDGNKSKHKSCFHTIQNGLYVNKKEWQFRISN